MSLTTFINPTSAKICLKHLPLLDAGGGNVLGLRRKELDRKGKPSGWSKLLGKIWPEGEISQPCNLSFKYLLHYFQTS